MAASSTFAVLGAKRKDEYVPLRSPDGSPPSGGRAPASPIVPLMATVDGNEKRRVQDILIDATELPFEQLLTLWPHLCANCARCVRSGRLSGFLRRRSRHHGNFKDLELELARLCGEG
jgi:hypothetical protein